MIDLNIRRPEGIAVSPVSPSAHRVFNLDLTRKRYGPIA